MYWTQNVERDATLIAAKLSGNYGETATALGLTRREALVDFTRYLRQQDQAYRDRVSTRATELMGATDA